MYKDKDKQREADKLRQRRYRRGLGRRSMRQSQGVTTKGVTNTGCDKQGVTDKAYHEAQNIKHALNEALNPPVAITAKRGKDIKCFEDLPPDVQQTIRRVSVSNEEFQKRTQIAIKYQHLISSTGSYKGFMDTLYDPVRINRSSEEGGGLKKGLTPQGGHGCL
ncbi:MAG: hypothetical protein KAS32_07710 [Candidatus Peribacteraceae bacterium]|nr:hypothetical protein [Candidatus Peribacteraceae bacterium]